MFVIRREQMEVFNQAALVAFENEMVAHSKDFSPRLCEVIGDEQLRVALRQAMDRARSYGFTNRGPIRLFIELMFLFGSAFDTDPQYPWTAQFLGASEDQMERAERLYQKTLDYQEKVSGPEAVNTRKALGELAVLARQTATISAKDFVARTLQEMNRAFPQKAAYIGEERLTALVEEGRAEARRYRFPTLRGEALIVVLMFAFGHGCTADPLYPWIERTLKDELILGPTARAERLERKAVMWLDHVLATPREGGQA
ncbi:MAG TPA: hypothetical protein VF173_23310 [Thermoanaerobaculia bacterium]|nr:hypothetical protein [Thermoanaerobaculia bacterium]